MPNQDKKIKELLKGNFGSASVSKDFTTSVMERIVAREAVKEPQPFKYKPVISNLGWMFMGVLFLAFVIAGFTTNEESKPPVFEYIMDWQLDSFLIQSPLVLLAILSIFFLLFLDYYILKYKFP